MSLLLAFVDIAAAPPIELHCGSSGEPSSLTPAIFGLLGTLFGAVVSFGGIVYKEKRGQIGLQRWIRQAHFDLFQDVADCAGEYDRSGNFGIFRERLSSQVRELRDGINRDLSGTISKYETVARSLSSVDYVMFTYDRNFESHLMHVYIHDCLLAMEAAQNSLGNWPPFRPNSEQQLMRSS